MAGARHYRHDVVEKIDYRGQFRKGRGGSQVAPREREVGRLKDDRREESWEKFLETAKNPLGPKGSSSPGDWELRS